MPNGTELPRCDRALMENGELVGIIAGGTPELIEAFVHTLTEKAKVKCDWHYVGGRGCILAEAAHVNRARETFESLRLVFRSASK